MAAGPVWASRSPAGSPTDLHDGTIGFADPEPGEYGARVRADLPFAPTRPRQEEIPVPESAAAPEGSSATAPPSTPSRAAVPSLTDTAFGDFWPDRAVPGNVAVLLGALGVGVLAGVVLPFRSLGLGTFLVLVAAGGVLLAASRHRHDPFTLTCAALCLALSATVVIRDAEWIVLLCLFAGAGLCAVGLVRGRSVPSFLLAALAWPLAGLRGLPWLGRTARRITGLGGGAALPRTAVWSVLGITVFALLFASADALFAEWADALFAEWVGALVPDLGSADLAARAFVTVGIGGIVLAGAYLALNPPGTERGERGERGARPVAHRFEWLAPVLVVDAVFIVFLVAQATVIFGGHDYLQRTTGLTYAEYVHQGFGQLTVATALTLLVVWAATRKARKDTSADRAWIRVSLGLLCALTLVVVASALYRMHLYQEAYGFTRMRLLVDVFEGWLGALVLATIAAGVTLRAAWLPRFWLFTGVALLLGLAAINPDAWIARQNLDRYEASGTVDWHYLGDLSDDALPVLATLPQHLAECALAIDGRERDDWLEGNLGRSQARAFIETHADDWQYREECPGQTLR